MFQIANYPHGADIQLLDTIYVNPHPTPSGKWTDGTLFVVYRDLLTNEKKVDVQKNPKTHIYFTKEEHKYDFKTRRKYLSMDKVDKVIVPYKDITKVIRDRIQSYNIDTEYLDIYNMAIQTKRNRMKKELYKWRHAYYSDYDIQDYVWTQTLLSYNQSNSTLRKGFLDIEVDVHGRSEMDRDNGACPISAMILVFNHDKHGNILESPIAILLLLRNHKRYKEQKYFEEHLSEFIDKCNSDFAKKYDNPKFVIKSYDDDLSLLRDAFGLIHSQKSDYIQIWNMDFDVNYIISRLRYLGENPLSYFTHPDFKEDPYINYYKDAFYANDFKNRCDYFDTTSYTRWVCMMLNYAGKRKSLSEYGGVGLDNIARIEMNERKREYSKPNVDVINAAIESYLEFALYTINDGLLLYGLDKVTEDLDALYDQAYYSGTRLTKVLKPSITIKSDFTIEYFKLGLVPGNNVNIDYSNISAYDENDIVRDDEDLAGALVGDPSLNAFNGVKIYGKDSNMLFIHCIDMDAAAMYPNIKIVFQLAEEIQYFRLIIEEQILPNENPLNIPTFMRGGKFVEDIECGDVTKLAQWFNVKPVSHYLEKFGKKRGNLIE